eukprot:CAMPEP_0171808764 /NCGR_PEP_ID=MMETSP0991-20121206/76575_1 /TAXON_ID=483369 /ORGANISM="non described non described, Strain CCMP2098" /LENGTH=97 /DNA_ID=CAMNT_0012421739 /DNA_START=23 /DNA_END=316 /DNA_ORIENTATION=-
MALEQVPLEVLRALKCFPVVRVQVGGHPHVLWGPRAPTAASGLQRGLALAELFGCPAALPFFAAELFSLGAPVVSLLFGLFALCRQRILHVKKVLNR